MNSCAFITPFLHEQMPRSPSSLTLPGDDKVRMPLLGREVRYLFLLLSLSSNTENHFSPYSVNLCLFKTEFHFGKALKDRLAQWCLFWQKARQMALQLGLGCPRCKESFLPTLAHSAVGSC